MDLKALNEDVYIINDMFEIVKQLKCVGDMEQEI